MAEDNGETKSEKRLRGVEERVALLEQAGKNRDEKLDNINGTLTHISGKIDELDEFMTGSKTGWKLLKISLHFLSAAVGAAAAKVLGVLSLIKGG